EKLDDLFDVDLFAIVFRRPTEQAKIIADRFRGVALLDVSGDGGAFVALAHLRTVAIQNQRNVSKVWWRRAESFVKLDVLRRVREMILAADDVRDFHLDVIDHIHEVKDPRAVRAPDGHVGMRRRVGEIKIDFSTHEIVDDYMFTR